MIQWEKFCGHITSWKSKEYMYQQLLFTKTIQVPTTPIYQDYTSTMSENAKLSISKQTRHLNLGYIFVTDKIKKGKEKVAYCPTENMLADFSPSHFKEYYLHECWKRY